MNDEPRRIGFALNSEFLRVDVESSIDIYSANITLSAEVRALRNENEKLKNEKEELRIDRDIWKRKYRRCMEID